MVIQVGSTSNYYFRGKDGNTDVVHTEPDGDLTVNLYANGERVAQCESDNGYYYLKDHLGDIKMILDEGGTPQVWNDYYPFGETMPGRSVFNAGPDPRYQYVSKEFDTEAGTLHFGQRDYDPWAGFFHSVDRFADKYPWQSPYSYALDNPELFVDINGDSVVTISGQQWIQPTQVTVTPQNQERVTIAIPEILGLGNLAMAQGAASLEAKEETNAFFGGIFKGIWTASDYVSEASNNAAALEVLATAPTGFTSDVGLPETLALGDVADITSTVAKGFGWGFAHNISGEEFKNQFLRTMISVGTLRLPAVRRSIETITRTQAAENAVGTMETAFDMALERVIK